MAMTDVLTQRLRRQLSESLLSALDAVVDEDPWSDDQQCWLPLSLPAGHDRPAPFQNDAQLAELRRQYRTLACENEFALNALENRISYVVGTGHRYQVAARQGADLSPELAGRTEAELNRFLRENRWHRRQVEIMRRRDRDGEVFLRLFAGSDGLLRVRFVEPEQIAPPQGRSDRASFGIETDAEDVERVLAYWVDGRRVDAAAIQHRKANVDANVKRGLSVLHPVRKNLRRAERLLRNMSVVAGVQSAVALIRKHASGTPRDVERFVSQASDATVQRPGGAVSLERFPPGTILDATRGIDYEFPVAAIDAGRYVTLLQAELRAIASRLVMPEFMLTSDASNANYASTLVAEGPAVKMFQRLQQEMIEDDLEILRRALRVAAAAGRLPSEAVDAVEIRAFPPSLCVRDRLKEAQADAILVRCKAMTPETMALRHGVEPADISRAPRA